MQLHEDVGDAPSVEERMPYGLSPAEVSVIFAEAAHVNCEVCGGRFHVDDVTITDIYEYCTMDVDPGSALCLDCYEACRDGHIPDDLTVIDSFTPLQLV